MVTNPNFGQAVRSLETDGACCGSWRREALEPVDLGGPSDFRDPSLGRRQSAVPSTGTSGDVLWRVT
jgi:hypothetical protein